jgi:hypothetical protein
MAEAGVRGSPPNTRQPPVMDQNSSPIGVSTAGQSRLPRPKAPAGLQTRDGQIGVPISRPTQLPQWPLPGPIPTPAASSDSEPYRPPPGRSQPPQRPPRPSRVPSILDNSRVQDHTPVFQYTPKNGRDSEQDLVSPVPPTPASRLTQTTLSSVGSIPDFPIPVAMPSIGPPRRSVNLGPPPSARRGASSFYSNASFVSPIPEESPRSRSHASFASSAAMPESWGSPSPGPSPNYPEVFFDDSIPEEGRESIYEDDGTDESRLVRNASIGKRGKPSLVMNKGASGSGNGGTNTMGNVSENENRGGPSRPTPSPLQGNPFTAGTGYVEGSSSSSTLPTVKPSPSPPPDLTPDAMLGAYAAASSLDPSDPRSRSTPSPRPYSRLSAIRRPPKLDMDAVNNNVPARGSMTSLPDLIKRATRLAAMIEKGRRPASRFDNFDDYLDEKESGRDGEKELSSE